MFSQLRSLLPGNPNLCEADRQKQANKQQQKHPPKHTYIFNFLKSFNFYRYSEPFLLQHIFFK